MSLGVRLFAGVFVGFVSAGLHAQERVERPAIPQPVPASTSVQPSPPKLPERTEPVKGTASEKIEILGPDEKPLPPEIEREVREKLKRVPPRVAKKELPPILNTVSSTPDATGDITVTGVRPRGSVTGDIPPERTFSLFDIRAYGASNIGELLNSLGPQVSSSRGREDTGPIVLLNGKRVSSFEEIAKIPTEAIERTEIFPEELSLKYGYRAEQKIVNIVTFEKYTSKIGQSAYTVPTEGGRDAGDINVNLLHLQGNTRLTFDADYSRAGSLLESDRRILQREGQVDLGRYRTLVPKTSQLTLNGTINANVLNDVSATLNGQFEASTAESLVGRGIDGPLSRQVDKHRAHLGTALGGAGKWIWSFTGNYDRTVTKTHTDTGGGLQDNAKSVNSIASGEVTLNGAIFSLPAGPVSTNLRGSAETRDFSSRSRRRGVEQDAELSRDRGTIQVGLSLPIASRTKKALSWLGNLSVSANFELEELSDLGTLRTYDYGFNWSPFIGLDLIGSSTDEEGAPTVEQLGSPLVVTPNVSTYDFARRESVDATRVYGGNRGLRSDDRHVVRLAANAKPFAKTDLTFNLEYTKTSIDNPIASFPVVTPDIETAFPERFTRDVGGRLAQVDASPLNFRRSDKEQVRWGINFTRPLGNVPAGIRDGKVRYLGGASGVESALPPGAKVIRPEAGSALAQRFENLSSRLSFSLYHTWLFRDEIETRDSGPVLNLINGSAIGNRGGSPRHKLQFQATAFKAGLGARLSVDWQSGTTVRGASASVGGTNGNLIFADYSTVSFNVFANVADRLGGTKAPAWAKNLRVNFNINNLLDSRPRVRDASGATPLSYQPAYLDPIGRTISLGVRKVF